MHPSLTNRIILYCPKAGTSLTLIQLEDVHFIAVLEIGQDLSMQLFFSCDHFTVVAISEQVIQRPLSQ